MLWLKKQQLYISFSHWIAISHMWIPYSKQIMKWHDRLFVVHLKLFLKTLSLSKVLMIFFGLNIGSLITNRTFFTGLHMLPILKFYECGKRKMQCQTFQSSESDLLPLCSHFSVKKKQFKTAKIPRTDSVSFMSLTSAETVWENKSKCVSNWGKLISSYDLMENLFLALMTTMMFPWKLVASCPLTWRDSAPV